MKRVSFVNLETLCWIDRLGTFEAAAKRLNTTQPAVSARVRELERVLGVPLFSRRGRRMQLTIEGRSLIAKAEPLLQQWEEMVVSLDHPASSSGVVRLAIVELVALTWAPRLIEELKRRMPLVTYEIDVDLSPNVKQRLAEGTIDVGIAIAPFDAPSQRVSSVGRVKLIWAASKILAERYRLDEMEVPEILGSIPIFSLPRPSVTHEITIETFKLWQVRKSDFNTCTNISMLNAIICNGVGIGLLPEILVADQLARGDLRKVSSHLQDRTFDYQVAWHEDHSAVLLSQIIEASMMTSSFDNAVEIALKPARRLKAVGHQL